MGRVEKRPERHLESKSLGCRRTAKILSQVKREKFSLQRRNPAQAGKLALALYYEDHGYEKVEVLSDNERFHMATALDGKYEIVLWGVTSGMAKVPLDGMPTAGVAIRNFDSGKGGLNDFLSKSECQYTHFAIVYGLEKSVLISTLS